eukprot:GHUV01019220.1.p1 GENE.GHUV01019220.1~~GHUV01019220.1.p1  ORF type:complete len:147 (+),score=9.99 GHUV01019220.1:334-774(+)
MNQHGVHTHGAMFHPQQTQGYVLCCLCGTQILSNPSNMCVNCIRSQVDITEGIQKQVTILWCKDCGRYLQPPKHWVRAEPESKELLTFCTKRIRGLQVGFLVAAASLYAQLTSSVSGASLGGQRCILVGWPTEVMLLLPVAKHAHA